MTFAARRPKPRRITVATSDSESEPISAVHKPTPTTSTSTSSTPRPKTKKPLAATSRLSFGLSTGDNEAADSSSDPVFTPKKSALSRKAMERNAARKKGPGPVDFEKLTLATPAQERVSYSKEALEELKSAQLVVRDDDEDTVMADLELEGATVVFEEEEVQDVGMDVDAAPAHKTEIVDEGLVRVLKQRRQQRAVAEKAGDYISLDGRGGGDSRLTLRPKKKRESRLARPDDFADDEEIANYVDDAERVLLTNSKAARREQDRRRKQTIRDTIAEAEGADDELDLESDVSKDSLVEEWERDQIRKGAFASAEGASRGLEGELESLAKNPPAAVALPEIGDVVASLERTLRGMQIRKRETEARVEALIEEKREIREREEMVQARLKEAGQQYERLKSQTGIGGAGPEGVVDRGLESFGNTPIRVSDAMRD